MPGLIILGFVALVVIWLWSLYNGLVTGKLRVVEAFAQIDVQLKRRADLIPNLVETVKGYAKHEKAVFEEVTKARAALLGATTAGSKATANNMLTDALKSVFAVAEAYPKLEASQNFKELQQELTDTEDKVAYARQFYNNVVMDYNTNLKLFPNVIFAQTLGFKDAEFFGNLTESEKQGVKVSFN